MMLGSYALAMQDHDAGRWRLFAAVTSVVLAAVVGLAAIYTATSSPGRGGDPAPAAALVVASTPEPTPASAPEPTPASTLGLAPGSSPLPGPAESEPAEPSLTTTPASAALGSEVADAAINPAIDPVGVDETGARAGGRDQGTPASTGSGSTVGRAGWVCEGAVQLEDPRGRDWSLGRASFLEKSGYERVVLHLERIGPGSGAPSAVTAEAFATSTIRGAVPGVPRPSVGQTTVSLHLSGGIEGNLGVRGYRPSGLRMLKEFSVYPAGRGSSRVLVSAAPGKCFRLRVPAWTAGSPSARKAQIVLDIK